MPDPSRDTPGVPPGWPAEPEYVRPAWMPAPHQQAPVQPYGQQPQQVVIHHHYALARRGPDVRQVLGWTAVGGIVTAALLAVATVAIALGLAALAMCVLALIVRGLWKDVRR